MEDIKKDQMENLKLTNTIIEINSKDGLNVRLKGTEGKKCRTEFAQVNKEKK